MARVKSIKVPQEFSGMRIDSFLAKEFPDFSRSCFQQLIREGFVKVNGAIVNKHGLILRGGEAVEVEFPEPEPSKLQPEPIPISVLYEDDDLLVINKPRGMVVHPGAGVKGGTLVNALLAMNIPLSDIAGPERLGIVHRLDKGTSGVMAVAKTNFAHLNLSRQFAERIVDKRYLAVVVGEPDFDHKVVVAPLAKHPEDPERFTVATHHTSHPIDAATEIWVRERFKQFALLEIKPITGRTHQIRVHLQYLGLPVVGDEVYNGRSKALRVARELKRNELTVAIQSLEGQALHAWKLTFTHPRTGEKIAIEAPLPDDMEQLLALLKGEK
ncbi:MAG: RluA family pseudouridine synthase [Candidatus Fervidibacter sp.]|uniref:RluA family pseudouridine synthase n=1 Tax=Candidatus Fervidibacter sp. TaxID=3100871 RepID=UPI00404A6304